MHARALTRCAARFNTVAAAGHLPTQPRCCGRALLRAAAAYARRLGAAKYGADAGVRASSPADQALARRGAQQQHPAAAVPQRSCRAGPPADLRGASSARADSISTLRQRGVARRPGATGCPHWRARLTHLAGVHLSSLWTPRSQSRACRSCVPGWCCWSRPPRCCPHSRRSILVSTQPEVFARFASQAARALRRRGTGRRDAAADRVLEQASRCVPCRRSCHCC